MEKAYLNWSSGKDSAMLKQIERFKNHGIEIALFGDLHIEIIPMKTAP